jgi:hypothetical protein
MTKILQNTKAITHGMEKTGLMQEELDLELDL